MNSWEILKQNFVDGARTGTIGRHDAVDRAANAFVSLKDKLSDLDDARKSFNSDEEVAKAIESKPLIKKLKEAGLI